MEKWQVDGYREVSFTDPKTNKDIEGFTLFLSRPAQDDKLIGRECQKLFISSEYVDYTPTLGEEIMLLYNRYGKVGSIQAC